MNGEGGLEVLAEVARANDPLDSWRLDELFEPTREGVPLDLWRSLR